MTDMPIGDAADLAPPPPPTFDALPLGADIRRAIDALGYKNPTPVQLAVYEPAARGKSLVVQARTGTGKTAAFSLPIVDQLVRRSTPHVQALILVPTRELALQVTREIEQLSQFRGLKVTAIYGGAPMGKQIEALEEGAQIVAGTPGRVLDHLRRGTLDPKHVRIFVLDEADEMLSMGFAKELHAIASQLPKDRQGLFFSATLPPDIERMAASQLKDPEFITLSSDSIGALSINHFVYVLRGGDKRQELIRILEVEDPESAVVFCNTKDETERLAEALQNKGYDADWLNGDLDQKERERVMAATREGKLRFLVATDVAARGIDISHLTHVINADFPETAEAYVHRTGRTGRAGRTGTAISLVGPKDIGNLYILRLTYKIRPLEKQLPSQGELKTRAEQDLVTLFADAFASRIPHPDDLALTRRLFTHPDAERIVAGLLRDHLGERAGDPAADAAESRRAKNPPAHKPPPPPPPPRAPHHRAPPPPHAPPPAAGDAPPPPREPRRDDRRDDRGPREPRRDDRPRDDRPRDDRPRDDRPRDDRGPREPRRDDRRDGPPPPPRRDERRDGPPPPPPRRDDRAAQADRPRDDRGPREPRPQAPPPPRPRNEASRREARVDDRHGEIDRALNRESNRDRTPPARPAAVAGARVPHSSFTEWEPPTELDDDKPIFSEDVTTRAQPPTTSGRSGRGFEGRGRGGDRDRGRGDRDRDRDAAPRGTREHEDDVVGYTVQDAPAAAPAPAAPRPPRAAAPRHAAPRAAPEGDATPSGNTSGSAPEGDELLGDFAELFINVGRREGAKPEDFQKIFDDVGLSASDVGRVRIRDRMSFVSVKKDTADKAIAALVGQVIGGRTVVAEIAKERGSARGGPRAY